MMAAFSYKGAAGTSAPAILKAFIDSKKTRYIDPMCGSCTVPMQLASMPRFTLALNDLNFYAYVNASSMFADFGTHPIPSAGSQVRGRLSKATWGFWSPEYRGYIDACLMLAQKDTTILAAVSRALLMGSYRGTAWSHKAPFGGLVQDWTADDARGHMNDALATIARKRRPSKGHRVTCLSWIQAVESCDPGPNDFIYIEPPFPWPEASQVRSDIYRWYDNINDILAETPPQPPVFDSSAEVIALHMLRWASKGAKVMLMKQTHSLPSHDSFIKLLGQPAFTLPIRGMPNHEAKEDFFVC